MRITGEDIDFSKIKIGDTVEARIVVTELKTNYCLGKSSEDEDRMSALSYRDIIAHEPKPVEIVIGTKFYCNSDKKFAYKIVDIEDNEAIYSCRVKTFSGKIQIVSGIMTLSKIKINIDTFGEVE